MSTQPVSQQGPPRSSSPMESLFSVVLGAILVLVGVAWILSVLDVVNLRLGILVPAALIVIGVALVVGSFSGLHGGLITLGMVLTIGLTIASIVNVPINGGVGDRSYAPTQTVSLPDQYQLMIGNLDIDLRGLGIPAGNTTIDARVGIGQLNIQVPNDVAVRVNWKVSAGSVSALGHEQNGTSLDSSVQTEGFATATKRLVINATVGIGDVKVNRP